MLKDSIPGYKHPRFSPRSTSRDVGLTSFEVHIAVSKWPQCGLRQSYRHLSRPSFSRFTSFWKAPSSSACLPTVASYRMFWWLFHSWRLCCVLRRLTIWCLFLISAFYILCSSLSWNTSTSHCDIVLVSIVCLLAPVLRTSPYQKQKIKRSKLIAASSQQLNHRSTSISLLCEPSPIPSSPLYSKLKLLDILGR